MVMFQTGSIFASNVTINATNTFTSSPIDVRPYKKFTLFTDMDTSGGTAQLRIQPQAARESTGNYFDIQNGPFGALDFSVAASSGNRQAVTGDCIFPWFRVSMSGTSTSAINIFTVKRVEGYFME